MSYFGRIVMGERVFGEYDSLDKIRNITYMNTIVGCAVRKSIRKAVTWRVRHGNGYYNSILGKRYQERFPHTTPSSINNPEGQTARDAMATAVANWHALSAQEKKDLDYRVRHLKGMTGFARYVGDYIKANA